MVEYFFDTYALIEIIEKNREYDRFAEHSILTFQMDAVEAYLHFLKKGGENIAKSIFFSLKNLIIPMEDEVIFEAMRMKKELSKKNLSYVDCLGYSYARLKGIRFVTGDKEFKGMPNVEFVR